MFISLVLLASAQSVPPAVRKLDEEWPTVGPRRVLSTPDWSDYKIYPKAAAKNNEQGIVAAETLIDESGRPRACRVLSTSYSANLDAGTCRLMMKMRFEPARDAAGKPIRSHYVRSFVWRLTNPQPFASSTLRARVGVENGKLTLCDIEGGDGPYFGPWSTFACGILADVPHFFGSRAGHLARAIVEIRLDAGDGAPFLAQPWSPGTLIAKRRVAFTINRTGDAANCTALEEQGLGPRGLNNLSPCGRLLSDIWFENSARGDSRRKGIFETRVVALDSQP
jgi:TonB family protein